MHLLSKVVISLGIFTASSAAIGGTVKLFNELNSNQVHAAISAKNHIGDNEHHLFSVKRAEPSALRALDMNDTILLNLPAGDVSAKVIDIYKGASGTKHIVVRSYIRGLPVSSIISLDEDNVFMELATEHGVFSAAGRFDEVLLHKPSELFDARGITFESDAKVPVGITFNTQKGTYTKPKPFNLNGRSNTSEMGSSNMPSYSHLQRHQAEQANKYDSGTESEHLATNDTTSLSDFGDIAEFDLLIVYSNNVTDVVDDINAKIDHYIAYTNRAFEDSGIYAKVRLKGVMQVEYPVTNGNDALEDITFGRAPFEGVANERIRIGADAVALLTPNSEGDSSAGIAWMVPHTTNSAFSTYRRLYSQTDVDYGASVFAHELGHNLGLGHSRPQGDTGADFNFGVGYRVSAPGTGFSTIMSYSTRDAYEVPFFSNPSLSCGSFPCGLPKDDQDFGADATFAINEVRERFQSYSELASESMLVDEALNLVTDENLRSCLSRQIRENTRYASEVGFISCTQEVASLAGIENFKQLTFSYFYALTAEDLTPLGSLNNLATLSLFSTPSKDFSFLTSLTQLESFSVQGDFFEQTQAEHLLSLVKLQRLSISSPILTQLPDLSTLQFLDDVAISANISDLSSIQNNRMLMSISINSDSGVTVPDDANWPLLETLSMRNGNLDSLTPLLAFENLRSLRLANNALTNLNGIEAFKNLEVLELSGNDIRDISGVSTLTALTELRIGFNPISDLSPLRQLTLLQELSIEEIDTNDLEPLSALTNLNSLSAGSYNLDADWSVISNMPKLSRLNITEVDTTDTPFLAEAAGSLTSLGLYQLSSPDLSFLFNHYKLNSLYVYPTYDTSFYCWQAEYLNSYLPNNVNVGYSDIENTCDTADDSNDYDNDGIANIDELANKTSPIEDNSAPSRIQFLVDKLDVFEVDDYQASRHTLVAKRSGDTSLEANVNLNVIDGTTEYKFDFDLSEESLLLEPGQSFTNFELVIFDDVRIEGEETFSLEFSDLINVELGDIVKIDGTINDNQDGSDFQNESGGSDTPSLGWDNLYSSANEQDEATTIVLNRPTGLAGSFSVELSAIALSDNAENQFELNNTTLDFDSTEAFKNISLSFPNDSVNTGSRFIAIRLINPANTIVNPEFASLTLEIKDDESTNAEIGFEQSYYRVDENVGSVELKLVRDTEDTIDREFSIVDRDFGTASLGVDASFAESSFVFPANQTEFFVTLTVIDDDIEEPLESLELELIGLPSDVKSENDYVSFYIDDNDGTNQPPTGTIAFSQPNITVDEADGTVNVTLIRENGSVGQRTVEVYAIEESASFEDFSFEDQTIVFEEGETQKTVSLAIVNDDIDEDSETFRLSIISADVETLGPVTDLQVQINDDDEPPAPSGTIGFATSTIEVNESEGSVQVSLLRKDGSNGELSVNVAAQNISTTSDDYTLADQTVNFDDGETEKVVTITIVDDTIDENTEQFSLSITGINDTAVAGIDTVTVSIVDNDDTPPPPTGGGSNGGASSSDSGGGSSGIMLLLLLPFAILRRLR